MRGFGDADCGGVGAGEGGTGFGEEDWDFGEVEVGFFGVVGVVEADAANVGTFGFGDW